MNKAAPPSIPEQKEHIAQLTQSGRHPEALHLANKLAGEQPENADAWFLLAGIHAQAGNLDEVITCCRHAARLNPLHTGALYNLATALLHSGLAEQATAEYRKCLSIDPGKVSALTGAGKAYQSLGDYKAARECFSAVRRIEPGSPQPLVNTGLAWQAEGDSARACECYEKALQLDPQSAEAHYFMGIAWQSSGHPEKAVISYRHAIDRRKDYMEAVINLSHILTELGHLQEAEALLVDFIARNPVSTEAHNNLGVILESMGKLEEAGQSYREAIRLNPSLTVTLCHLAYMLSGDGRTDEALAYFDHALALEPGLETALAGKASTLERLGKFNEALRTIGPVIDKDSRNPDVVLAWCKLALRTGKPDPAIELASSLLETDNLPAKAVSDLNRILGELHDRMHKYEIAFRHFERSNRASPCTYNHDVQVKYFDRIIKNTTQAALATLPRTTHDHRGIVFIVGMPRSGTSLVEQVLASHPDVYGAGELRIIGDIADSLQSVSGRGRAYPEAIADLDQAGVDQLSTRYLDFVNKLDYGSVVLTDKMPHNFIYLGLIALILPGAKVIHVRRSPLDNCLSLYFQGFNAMHSYTTDLGILGKYYRQYERIMKHWEHVLDIPMLDIFYEDMIDDLDSCTHRLLKFCGLPWAPDCVQFYKNERFVKTPSYDQVRQPVYKSSSGRWRNYRQFITPLVESLGPDSRS